MALLSQVRARVHQYCFFSHKMSRSPTHLAETYTYRSQYRNVMLRKCMARRTSPFLFSGFYILVCDTWDVESKIGYSPSAHPSQHHTSSLREWKISHQPYAIIEPHCFLQKRYTVSVCLYLSI